MLSIDDVKQIIDTAILENGYGAAFTDEDDSGSELKSKFVKLVGQVAMALDDEQLDILMSFIRSEILKIFNSVKADLDLSRSKTVEKKPRLIFPDVLATLRINNKIQKILNWAPTNKNFNTKFVRNMEQILYSGGTITEKREKALDNIIEKWVDGDYRGYGEDDDVEQW